MAKRKFDAGQCEQIRTDYINGVPISDMEVKYGSHSRVLYKVILGTDAYSEFENLADRHYLARNSIDRICPMCDKPKPETDWSYKQSYCDPCFNMYIQTRNRKK